MISSLIPAVLYHATPLYRYDPEATTNHGSWSVARHGCIKGRGLMPRCDSSIDAAAVYLASECGVAENYASGNFGEELPVEWVVLEIDATQLDPALFSADLDQEAQIAADDFVLSGFSYQELSEGSIPWHASMAITGQVKYAGVIPDHLIRVLKIIPCT